MKHLTLLVSVFGSLISFANPTDPDGSVTLHAKVYDLMSRLPIQVDVSVIILYNSDFIKDDSCKTVNGEFTKALDKYGWYMISLTADGYLETTDTLWVVSAARPIIEREYFMSQAGPANSMLAALGNEVLKTERNTFPGEAISIAASSACSFSTAQIYFAFGKCGLLENSINTLNGVTEFLKVNPSFVIEIAGYTDHNGPEDYNLMLSQWRAESVKQYLLSHGVNQTQLIVRSYGESNPVNSGATYEERAKNRRVELVPIPISSALTKL
jgi:OmpA-OmpF porin, OOP family